VNHKIILPFLALAMAVLACQFQSAAPPPATPATASSTDTPLPPAPTGTPIPATAMPAGLTLDMLKNGTYHAPAYDRTITLVNGAYTGGSGVDTYTVSMLDVVAFGDLNGDGVGDAAIILVENDGGSGQFESLVAVLDVGGTPTQAGQAQLGDRVQVNSLMVNSGTIALDMLVQGPNDPMCCPSLPETQSYRMVESALWLTRLTSRTSDAHERSISISSPADNATVNNPFMVSGSVTIAPFENTLACRVYLPDGTKVNESPLLVDSGGIAGGPGTFSQTVDLSNAGITGPVILQFLDLSAADGSTLAMGSVVLTIH
jgi:hypothetical protein